jgi:hypothetical protein
VFQLQEDKSIDMPSLLDVLWEALQEACEQTFLTGPYLPRVAPVFQCLLSIIQSRHPCRMILLSQPQFWSKVHRVWAAAFDRMDADGVVDGHVALVTHIFDLVTCVVFDVWNTHSNGFQPGIGTRSGDPDSEGALIALPELRSTNVHGAREMPTDLKKLLADICTAEGILSSWILNQAQSRKLLEGSDDAESLLIEAAEAAAVLVRIRIVSSASLSWLLFHKPLSYHASTCEP